MTQEINVRRASPVHGGKLSKDSVAGRKSQFILVSNTATTDFNVTAGSMAWVVLQGTFWSPELPTGERNAINMVTPADIIASDEVDAYVDVDQDVDHLMGVGGLSSGQLEVIMSKWWLHTPRDYTDAYGNVAPYTTEAHYAFFNNDGSDHHIYFYSTLKFIIYGDVNL